MRIHYEGTEDTKEIKEMTLPLPFRILLLCLLSLCPLCLCGESPAADPETTTPYRLQVVLHFADNASLTPLFKSQIERELRDNFRAAFGNLVQVEVVREHSLLKDIDEKGLQSALDSWKAVSDTKSHFVVIDFVGGQYEIQARQHDGLTGQASPVIRRERTSDRQFVARTIALLIDRDFGLVGTVAKKVDDQTVELALKGAGLGVPLDHWVKKGDIFNLVQILKTGGRERAVPVRNAALQVQENPDKEGKIKCRLFNRFLNPLAMQPGSIGFRCVRLGTTTAPVRVRLVRSDAKSPTPVAGLPIVVRRSSFEGAGQHEEGATDSDGFYQTDPKTPYENIAFVSVVDRDTGKDAARIPVPIINDQPVVIPVNVKTESMAPLLLRRGQWTQRLYEALLANRELFKDLNELAGKMGQRPAAVAKAKSGLKLLQEDLDNLTSERKKLVEAAAEPPVTKLDLADGDKALKQLERDRDELRDFVDDQDKVLAQETDPNRREQLAKIAQAQALEREAEFGKALALFREAQEVLKQPMLQERIDRLAAAWKIKDNEHEMARRFIYEVWPEFDQTRMKERIAKAREAFDVYKRAGDVMTPRKFLKDAITHLAKLNQLQAGLNTEVNEDDRKQAEELGSLVELLDKLMGDVGDYLKTAKPAK
jgi:tetratricopeptide (TPR) repeat protein